MSRIAVTRPMPRAPPVMRATFVIVSEPHSRRVSEERAVDETLNLCDCEAASRLLLVLVLQRRDDRRIGERGHVAERAAFGDVAEEAAHDLARARLRKIGGDEDLLR